MTEAQPIRIAFVLTAFLTGGAEMMLWKLLSRLDRRRFSPFVIALSSQTDGMLERFQRIGVPWTIVDMRPGPRIAGALMRLRHAVRDFDPHIVQGWLYHGNLAAMLAIAGARPRVPLLWNIRGALIDREHEKRQSTFIVWLCGKLSRKPARIINNSVESALQHEQRLGYCAERRVILPNGFDTEVFKPSGEARKAIRSELGLAADSLLVGLVARYHPMKDHANFLRAATIVRRRFSEVHYVLAGEGIDARNQDLTRLMKAYGLEDRVHLLGPRSDTPAVLAALDLSVSASSSGEGFPNVVGEAMSCGVPCVVTDVGDSAAVVGETGFVVPARDSEALAIAIEKVIAMPQQERKVKGQRARERVVANYSLDAVVRQYEELYAHVRLEAQRHGRR